MIKKHNLFILCGIPASGKSTWAKKWISAHPNDTLISRDEIRFLYIKTKEDYFSQEKKVYRMFVSNIQKAIDEQKGDVFADATHINWASRSKLLNALDVSKVNVNVIVFDTDINTCFSRNEKRKGLEFISKSIIRRFSAQYEAPEKDPYTYNKIIHVKEK